MKQALRVLAGIVGMALLAGGCGGDDDEGRPAPAEERSGAVRESGPDAPAANEAPQAGDGGAAAEATEAPGETENEAGARSTTAPVRATLRTFLKGMGDGDPGTVCSTYTREVRALVGRTLSADCPTGMDFAFRSFGVEPRAFRRVRVRRVRVTGDRAVAQLSLPARLRALPMMQIIAPRRQLTLEREAGRWRLGLAVL